MVPRDVLAQARYIYTTRSKIRNYFFKSHKKLVSVGRHTSGKKLSLSQFNVIDIMITHGRITVTELSEILGVSPPSTTAMVDRLIKKGFLIREHSSKDRRKVIISFSPEAKEDIEDLQKTMLEPIISLIEKIGPETAKKWCEVLNEVEHACGRINNG